MERSQLPANGSFRHLQAAPPKQIQLILHTGGKPITPQRQFTLVAPANLLAWPAPDRCVATLQSAAAAEAHEADVVSIVRQWFEQR